VIFIGGIMEKQPNKEYQPLFYMQTLDGEQLGCSTANTFAFLHDDPKYDHIFYLVEADAEDEHDYGHYFWRNSIPEFDKLVEFMDTNGFYVEIGNDPAEVDVHQYLEDNPPLPNEEENWSKEYKDRADKWGKFVVYLFEQELKNVES